MSQKLFQYVRPQLFLVTLFSEFFPDVTFVQATKAHEHNYANLPVVIIQTDVGEAVSNLGDARQACAYTVTFSIIAPTEGRACTLVNDIYGMCVNRSSPIYEHVIEGRTWLKFLEEGDPPHEVMSTPAVGSGTAMYQWNTSFEFIIRNRIT